MMASFDLTGGDAVHLATRSGLIEITAFDADNGFEAIAWATPEQAVRIARGLMAAAHQLDPSLPPAVTE